jgi:cytochrome P450
MPDLLNFLATIIIATLLYFFRHALLFLLTPRGIPYIPSWPDPVPLLGDFPRLYSHTKETWCFNTFTDLSARTLGPICQFTLGFFRTMVVVSDYEAMSDLLTRQQGALDQAEFVRKVFATTIPECQISLTTGDKWRYHRRVAGYATTPKNLARMMPKVNEAVTDLIGLMEVKRAKAGDRPWASRMDLNWVTLVSRLFAFMNSS